MDSEKHERAWDLDAGNLGLDFANTVDWHESDDPQELLKTYPDLVLWAQDADLLSDGVAAELVRRAAEDPQSAAAALKRARDVREMVFRIFRSLASGDRPQGEDLFLFNRALSEALGRARVEVSEDGFVWDWTGEEDSFQQMLWPVLRAAADLLTSTELGRVGVCADQHGCGFLFIDTSRNRSRKWCSMDSCGNRAKARRYYERSVKGG